MLTITPSLPAQSFEELQMLTKKLAGTIPMFQVDIVDGIFVPFKSWPFVGTTVPHEEFKKLTRIPVEISLEIDCMVMHPEQYLDIFATVGIKSLIVHVGSTDAYDTLIARARSDGYCIGLAITSDVSLEILESYVKRIDFVQVMGIAHVGKQGQPFDERTLDTLRMLRSQHPTLSLVVDGAVNDVTAPLLVQAGATRLAPGSYIAKAEDPLGAYKQLCALLGV